MKITKLQAAQRQLDCAIRLYLNDDDLSSIVTLSRAAFRLLWDIYPTTVDDGFDKALSRIIGRIGWTKFSEIANFLKHADRDTDARMAPDDIDARIGIGLAVILYGRIAGCAYSSEMKAWETMMTLAEPEVWDSHPDPTHEGYPDFVRALTHYQKSAREERLAMARRFLQRFYSLEQINGGRGESPCSAYDGF